MKITMTWPCLCLWILFILHTCDHAAQAHGIHLNDYNTGNPTIEIEPGSFDGMTLKGTDGKCYVVYIDQVTIGNDHRQLHLREIPCDSNEPEGD